MQKRLVLNPGKIYTASAIALTTGNSMVLVLAVLISMLLLQDTKKSFAVIW